MANQEIPHHGTPKPPFSEHSDNLSTSTSAANTTRLDYHIPFTLRSPDMARYIATMSVRQQEAFEVEMARKQARIRLREAREAEAARRAQVKRDIEQHQMASSTKDPVKPTRTRPRELTAGYSLPTAQVSNIESRQLQTLDSEGSGPATTVGTSHSNVVTAEPTNAPPYPDPNRGNEGLGQPPNPAPSLGTISTIRTAEKSLFKKNDIIIAVMGPAGSGKTSFIQSATGQDLGVRHGLLTHATEITTVRVPLTDEADIVLLDTPGFDDTKLSYFFIIEYVSNWLEKAYGGDVPLSGILYIQSIFDEHGSKVLQKNFDSFRRLCGQGGFQRIVITTTMWSGIDSEAGATREDELRRDYWAEAVKGGSVFLRFDHTRGSAWQILDHILTLELNHRWIETQAELATFKAILPNTEAGQQLAGLIEDTAEALQDIRNRMKENLVKASDSGAMYKLLDELDRLRPKQTQIDLSIRQIDPSLLGRLEYILAGRPEPSGEATQVTPSFLQDQCQALILRISEKRESQGALIRQLRGDIDEAQQIIDFLNMVLNEVDATGSDKWKEILSLYFRLAEIAQVYPQSYELKGIRFDTTPAALGAFAMIYKGTYQNQSICLKLVKKADDKQLRTCIRELTLWAHLSHANILPFYGMYTIGETSQVCLVSPWINNGNLRDYVDKNRREPRMPWIHDIVEGLIYLHQLDIVHGDLKGSNILVSDDGRALIADFGLSWLTPMTQSNASTVGGTTRWMAPELLDEHPSQPTKACDMWSFGCLCYEILSRKIPFYHYKWDAQVIAALQRRELPRRPEGVDTDAIDDQMWSLMMECWQYTPQDRPTLERIRDSISSFSEPRKYSPEAVKGENSALTFRKAIMTKSGVKVDFERVYQILGRVGL